MSDTRDTSEVNFHALYDALRQAYTSIEDGHVEEAIKELGGLDRADIPKELEALLVQVHKGLGGGADAKAEAVVVLDRAIVEVQQLLPRFRLVLIDETHHWLDEKLRAAAGTIWGAYLYDENRPVYTVDTSPSFEMYELGSHAKNLELPETFLEQIEEGDRQNSGGVTYMYAREVKAISWRNKLFCGEVCDRGASSYRDMLESELEHYKCNLSLEAPDERAEPSLLACLRHMVKRYTDLNGSDPWDAQAALGTALAIASEHSDYARRTLQDAYHLMEHPGGFERAMGAVKSLYESFTRPLGPRGLQLPPLDLATFNRELLTVYGEAIEVANNHGAGALADVWQLQDAILRGGLVQVAKDSSELLSVLSPLPSFGAWMGNVVVREDRNNGRVLSNLEAILATPGIRLDGQAGFTGLDQVRAVEDIMRDLRHRSPRMQELLSMVKEVRKEYELESPLANQEANRRICVQTMALLDLEANGWRDVLSATLSPSTPKARAVEASPAP